MKYDGYRGLLYVEQGTGRLVSRHDNTPGPGPGMTISDLIPVLHLDAFNVSTPDGRNGHPEFA
jgi:hypothetical protein